MIEAVAQWKAVIVAVWFAAFFALERIAAMATAPGKPSRLVKNGALWLVNTAMWPFLILPLTMFAVEHPLWVRPAWLQGWQALLLDLIILDLWTYWLHRAYHRVPAMWRLHQVHHRDQHLDTTSSVRFHFGEVILSASLRMAPIVILAVPLVTVIIFEMLLLIATIFHHSNVRLPEGVERALSRVVVTPSIHWVHHHAVTADTDSNYAAILSIWDRLFASRSSTRRTKDMKIGVEGVEDKGLLRLIAMPIIGDRQ